MRQLSGAGAVGSCMFHRIRPHPRQSQCHYRGVHQAVDLQKSIYQGNYQYSPNRLLDHFQLPLTDLHFHFLLRFILMPILLLPSLPPPPPPITASYIYDFPTLALFTLGLTLLAQWKMVWFLLIFMFGCVNKETIVLLTLIYMLECAQYLQLSR